MSANLPQGSGPAAPSPMPDVKGLALYTATEAVLKTPIVATPSAPVIAPATVNVVDDKGKGSAPKAAVSVSSNTQAQDFNPFAAEDATPLPKHETPTSSTPPPSSKPADAPQFVEARDQDEDAPHAFFYDAPAADSSSDTSSDDCYPEPGFFARTLQNTRRAIRDAVGSVIPPVKHSLDKPSQKLLTDAISAIKGAPASAVQAMRDATASFWKSIQAGELPPTLQSFIKYILDAISLAVATTQAQRLVHLSRMALDYGPVITAAVASFSWLVTQFTNRVERAVDQGDNDPAPTPESTYKETIVDSLRAFYNMVHYYTIGSLPDSIPAGLIKQIVAINAAFVFGRNIQPIGSWIVALLKTCVDYIWRKVMGIPFFDSSAKDAALALSLYCANTTQFIRSEATPSSLAALRSSSEQFPTLMANAVAAGLPTEVLNSAKLVSAMAERKINELSAASTSLGITNPTVIYLLYGGAGKGKSVVNDLLARAMSKAMGYPEKYEDTLYTYNPNLTFQKRPNPVTRHWSSDDALLIKDPDIQYDFFNTVIAFGTGKPVSMEMSTAENRIHLMLPSFAAILENKKPEAPVTTPEAFNRRINGGSWEVTVADRYKDGQYLDFTQFVDSVIDEGPEVLDDVFVFTCGPYQYSFSQLVSALCNLRRKMDTGAAKANTVANLVSAKFNTNFDYVLPDKVTDYNKFDLPKTQIVQVSGHVSTNPRRARDHATTMDRATFDEYARASRVPEEVMDRIWSFLKTSSSTYSILNSKLLKDGKPVDITALVDRVVPKERVDPIDFEVSLNNMTPALFSAMRHKRFHVKGGCCRHGDWCYAHGTKICQSYDPDVVDSNFAGFCWWLVENNNGSCPCLTAAQVYAAAHSPVEESYTYSLLRMIGSALLGAGVGVMVGAAINMAYKHFYPQAPVDHSDYSPNVVTPSAKGSSRPTAFPKLGLGEPTDHANVVAAPEITNGWVVDYLNRSSIPMTAYGEDDAANSHLLGIVGNLAVVNRHPFIKKRSSVALHAPLLANLPVKIVEVKDLVPETTYVQLVAIPNRDEMFAILPKPLANFRDSVKHWVKRDTALEKLTSCSIAMRKNTQVNVVDGRVVPRDLAPLHPFPLGHVNAVRQYESSASYAGLYIRAPVSTVEGNCGLPVFSSNTHIERGSACLFGIVTARSDATGEQIVAPLCREDITEFMAMCPPGVLHAIKDHSESMKLDPPTIPNTSNIIFAGAIPGRAPFTNTKNDIYKFPPAIYHALDSMVVDLDGTPTPLPPIAVRPANLRNLDAAMAKYQASTYVPKEADYQHFLKCVAAVKDDIINKCDQRLLEPQTSLWTLHQVLNGVPEFRIPKIDPRKSTGFIRGGQPAKGRYAFLDEDEHGVLTPTPEFAAFYYKRLAVRLTGELPENFVLINPKSELRPFAPGTEIPTELEDDQYPDIFGEPKRARLTAAMEFVEFLVDRTFAMHLPAVIITGQIANGCSFGINMNGPAATELGRAQEELPYRNSSDATNYDASKGVFYSKAGEDVCQELIRLRFPFVTEDAARTVPRGARVGRYIIRGHVFDMICGFISGHPLTTVGNSIDMTTQGRYTYTKYGGLSQEEYTRLIFALAYGDDYLGKSREPHVDGHDFVKAGEELGITLTPASDKNGEQTAYVPLAKDVHLKRHSRKVDGGRYMAHLSLDVLNHIHAFGRGKLPASVAAPIAARSAVREFFYLGERNFNEAKRRLDTALTSCGFERTGLDYLDLYHQWEQGYTGAHSFRMFGRSAEAGGPATDHSSSLPLVGTATDKDTQNRMAVNAAAVTKVDGSAGVDSQQNLTKYMDAAALIVNEPTPKASLSSKTELNPYPPIGVEDLLTREYEIFDGTWNTTAVPGTVIHDAAYPETQLNLTNVSSKLARNVFFRAGIEFTVRTTGNQFTGGSLMVNVLPCHVQGGGDAWREHYLIMRNQNPVFISASKSDAVKIVAPWVCPTTWFHLVDLIPKAALCHFFLTVNTKLEWMSADPPTGINVKVFARFIDVQVSGYNTNPGPSLSDRIKAGPKTFGAAIANPKRGGKAKDHSSEAKTKSADNVMEGVGSVVQTVKAITGVVGEVMPLLGLLDKPPTVQATAPFYNSILTDMIHTNGMAQVPTIAAHQTTLVATKNAILGEASPQPSWNQISGLPGVIKELTISADATTGEVINTWEVHPNMNFPVPPTDPPTAYVMTPTSYVAQHHRYWHGDLKYKIYLWGPSTQKCSVRVVFYPVAGNTNAVGPDDSGDVLTGVVDVVGDTEIEFVVPFNSMWANLPMYQVGGLVGNYWSLGSCVLQMVSPISAQSTDSRAPIHGLLYIATANNFSWNAPAITEGEWVMSTELPAAPAPRIFGAKILPGGKAHDHSAVRASFGKEFKPLAPATSKTHVGLCDPDKTHGPVEFYKRAMQYEQATQNIIPGTDISFTNEGLGSTVVHPFKFWSGSTNRHYVIDVPPAPANPLLAKVEGIFDGAIANGSGGIAHFNVNETLSFSFSMPFTSAVPARETHATHPEFFLGDLRYRVTLQCPTAIPAGIDFTAYTSAGDDFALYLFQAPAFLIKPA